MNIGLPVSRAAGLGVVVLLVTCSTVWAQKAPGTNAGATGTSSPGAGTGTATGTRSNPMGTNTGINNTNNSGNYDQMRPIFLNGNVMFDDGTAPTSEIRIERVCNGNPHLETHTDSKGRFSFQVGGEVGSGIADADASNNSFGTGRNANSGFNQTNGGSSFGSNKLMGCELRAAYPGYVSETVDLSMRHSLDDPKVGTILLRHLGNVKGTTISVTTAEAPKSAQKSFDKGNQLVQKGKFEEAEEKYLSATTDYPKFAAAWFSLGQVQERLNKPEEAKKAFLAAMGADSHFVSPYDQLALLSAQQGKWEDAAKYSKQAVDLNPVEFPSSFWYNALANYNLKNYGDSEKSAKALIKLDSRRRFPEAERLLAEFASNRGDLDDTAAHLKAYLAAAPNSKSADTVKSDLARIEEARATQAKNAPATTAAH